MSFILDALRKAETRNRDRHNMTVPTGPRVLTEELPEAPVEPRSFIWVGVLGVVVAGLAWWLWSGNSSSEPQSYSAEPNVSQPAQAHTEEAQQQIPETPTRTLSAERTSVQRETGARA